MGERRRPVDASSTRGSDLERVLIEVERECGGLPNVNVDELLRPFEQRGADHTPWASVSRSADGP